MPVVRAHDDVTGTANRRITGEKGAGFVKLLHTREARIVDGSVRGTAPDAALVIEGKSYGVLEASDAGLQLVDATDEERCALVEAGYALPSHVAPADLDS